MLLKIDFHYTICKALLHQIIKLGHLEAEILAYFSIITYVINTFLHRPKWFLHGILGCFEPLQNNFCFSSLSILYCIIYNLYFVFSAETLSCFFLNMHFSYPFRACSKLTSSVKFSLTSLSQHKLEINSPFLRHWSNLSLPLISPLPFSKLFPNYLRGLLSESISD